MLDKLIYGAAGIILIAGLGFYVQHVWSDCLAENSWLTCTRILSK